MTSEISGVCVMNLKAGVELTTNSWVQLRMMPLERVDVQDTTGFGSSSRLIQTTLGSMQGGDVKQRLYFFKK